MSLQSNSVQEHDHGSVPVSDIRNWIIPLVDPMSPIHLGWQDQAIEDMRRLSQASSRLRTVLEQHEVLYAVTLERLRSGMDAGPSLDGTDVAAARETVVDALVSFDRARHVARGTFIRGQHFAGMNMKQIGEAWGISRQLAHRYFQEGRLPF